MKKRNHANIASLRTNKSVMAFMFFYSFSPVLFAQDVVEIETEIGVEQIKPATDVAKPGIKPRVNYVEPEPSSSPNALIGDQQSRDGFPTKTLGNDSAKEMITDGQFVEISASLRSLIEENERLKKELDGLDQQLRNVRGQQKLEANRVNEIAIERDALKKQNENIIARGAEAQDNLTKLQKEFEEKENNYTLQIVRLNTELANAMRANPPAPTDVIATSPASSVIESSSEGGTKQSVVGPDSRSVSVNLVSNAADEDLRQKSEKVLMTLDTITKEQVRLARDEAKVHYNMGNTYFNEGDYQKANEEYLMAVNLAPDDANAHYNLAFVSGEFLNDPATCLEHYKKYLFLNPGAQDADMVRQKMIEAEVLLKANVRFESDINKEVQRKKNEYNEDQPYH